MIIVNNGDHYIINSNLLIKGNKIVKNNKKIKKKNIKIIISIIVISETDDNVDVIIEIKKNVKNVDDFALDIIKLLMLIY